MVPVLRQWREEDCEFWVTRGPVASQDQPELLATEGKKREKRRISPDKNIYI